MRYPRYPAYKDFESVWMDEVPAHWEIRRLRYACNVNPTKSEVSDVAPEMPVSFLPMENIGEDGTFSLEEERTIDRVRDGYTYFRNGDVGIAKITPCFENGKGALFGGLKNGIGFGTTELHILRARRGTSPEYVFYLTRSNSFRKLGAAVMYGSAGQKRVPEDFVRDFTAGFPPFPEQRAIADFLDRETAKIDTLVDKQKRLIELLEEKRATLIQRVVTRGLNTDVSLKDSGVPWIGRTPAHWDVRRLKHMGEAIIGLTYDPDDVVDEGEGVLVLRASNVDSGRIQFGDDVYVRREIPDRLITRVNDILICSRSGSRALIGKNAKIGVDTAGLTFGTFMTVFRSRYNDYLFHVFNSKLFEYQSGAFLTSTINQLTVSNLNNFEVTLPPLRERRAIAAFLDQETATIESLIDRVQEMIERLQEYRTALISAAVTGRIDVRDEVSTA